MGLPIPRIPLVCIWIFWIELSPRRDLGSCSRVPGVRGRGSQGSGGEGGGREAPHPAQAPEQGRDHREDGIPVAQLFVLHGQETQSYFRQCRERKVVKQVNNVMIPPLGFKVHHGAIASILFSLQAEKLAKNRW